MTDSAFRCQLFPVVALLVLGTLITGIGAAPAEAALLAGGATRSISPWDLNRTWLGGFDEARKAEGIHDDIKARAMALSDGNETIILVALDLTAHNSWRINPVRERIQRDHGIPLKNTLVCSTHTHAAPDTMGVWGPDLFTPGRWEPYSDFVDQQIYEAATAALADLRPARIRTGLGSAAGMFVDKRDPQVFDNEVLSLQAVAPDGNAIFTLVNVAVHPEVTFRQNLLVTADFPFFQHERLEAHFGGVSIFTAGNLGGLIAPLTADFSFAECQRYGEDIADIVIASLTGVALRDDIRLTTARERILLPVSNPLYFAMGLIGLLEIDAAWLQAQGGGVPIDLVYWQIGDEAEILNLPGELFPEAGWRLKGFMATDRRFCVNLGNEQIGYLLPAEDYHFPDDPLNPGSNYEETLSPGIEAVPAVFSGLHTLLGAPSPTPFFSPTPTGTPSPTQPPSPTPSPTPTQTPPPTPAEPSFFLAGFLDSDISAAGGALSLIGWVPSQPQATGLPPIDESLAGFFNAPVEAGFPAGAQYLIELEWAPPGRTPVSWPHLTVTP